MSSMNNKDSRSSFNKNDKLNKILVDEAIRSRTVLVISDNGDKPQVMNRDAAIKLAKSKGLNLVEVYFNKQKDPASTCKIVDSGKYIYNLRQKEKLAKKQARAAEIKVKEVKFHLTSDVGDVDRKIAQAKEFISEGDKVKITMQLRGGERRLKDMVHDKMVEIINNFNEIAILDGKIEINGKYVSAILRPISKK